MKGLDFFVRLFLLPGAVILVIKFVPLAVRDIKDYIVILGLDKKHKRRKKTILTCTAATVRKNSFSQLPDLSR